MPEDTDRLAAAAREVADTPIPLDTGLLFLDGDPDLFATYLAPRPWHERADLINGGLVRDLDNFAKVYLDPEHVGPEHHRGAVDALVKDLRETIMLILARLEEIAPLPLTVSAMKLYRLSADERHVRTARAWFETDEVEERAYTPCSALAFLRVVAALHDAAAGRGAPPAG